MTSGYDFTMSGHSKWANIRVRKGAQDAKRGKIFTRHARLIEMAVRAGGEDPKMNATLRTAIDNAKAESVPNDNIERAIKKGSGALKGEAMQEIIYEAYGPGGAAFIIECLSDNRNRTIANVKLALSKKGGRFAESGSVAWMFERKGLVVGELRVTSSELRDTLELELIDVGADDVSFDESMVHVVTAATKWTAVRDFLNGKGLEVHSAGLSFIPKQKIDVTDAAVAAKIQEFIEAIEEDDDVSEVHTNAVLH
jgi:YebC/PmpR family DNA-binding regulatory protein